MVHIKNDKQQEVEDETMSRLIQFKDTWLTLVYTLYQSFLCSLSSRESICRQNLTWELVPQEQLQS